LKILLTQDVQGLGKAGQIKEVHDGYARNYLLPRGLAVFATPAEMKKREVQEKSRAIQDAKQADAGRRLADRIAAVQLVFRARVGEQHRLFGSITTTDIAEAMEKQLGEPIDRHRLVLEEPIKHLGTFKVPVHLGRDLSPEVTVVVEPEE
jgi:large subunit ribosomal protein L9